MHTRHAGQQGLRVRSDEKVFATAGWDARIRVYAVKTMEELAVLKWHKEGCYATAFAEVDATIPITTTAEDEAEDSSADSHAAPETKDGSELATRQTTVSSFRSTARRRREAKAQAQHWIAAGSKDGKVSLWDIY
ncbi:MAG: hypothetical protein INR71_05960 [Terriglobus roseus]|nr:hypothetical protein [Terriglobus roseus]